MEFTQGPETKRTGCRRISVGFFAVGGYAYGGEALRVECQHMLQNLDYVGLRHTSRRLYDKAVSEKDSRLAAYASYYLAASELKTGSVASARRHAAAADSLAAISGNDTLRASSLNLLGIIANEYSRNNALALGYYLKALDYAGRIDYNPVLGGIYSNISLLFISHNDTAGLRYCKESYRIGKETGRPENLYYPAFAYCSGLKMINIPESCLTLDNYLFDHCTSLSTVYLPSQLETLPFGIFAYCTSLPSIWIPNTIKTIMRQAFENCFGLETINLPESIEFMDEGTFFKCLSLKNLTFPTSMKVLPYQVCQLCESLEWVKLPPALEELSYGAFQKCESLKEIEIPETVTSIGDYAFVWCTILKEISIPNNVTYYGDMIFVKCTSLEKVKLSDGNGGHVPNIRAGMFTQCDNLTEIEIPEGVTTIAEYAFALCPKVNVKLPSTLTTIGGMAFRGCNALTTVDFGPEMKYVGYQAFFNCPNLEYINSENTVPPTLDGPCFEPEAYSTVQVTVPASALEAYKRATEWKEFLNIKETNGIESVEAGEIISVGGLDVTVNDADAFLEIYNLSGMPVYSGVPGGEAVSLPSAGVYVLRIDGRPVKISVK